MPEELTPVIREEEYLAAIAGQDVTPPDPATRKEEWLDAIADHLDAVAPTPAAEDSGKVLTAGADGTASWQTAGGGGGAFIIDVTYQNTSGGAQVDTWTQSKTFAEIEAAWSAGQYILARYTRLDDSGEPVSVNIYPWTYRYSDPDSTEYQFNLIATYKGETLGEANMYTDALSYTRENNTDAWDKYTASFAGTVD